MEELDLMINILRDQGGIGFPLILTLYEEFPCNFIEKSLLFVTEGFLKNLCINVMIIIFYTSCLF